MQKKLLRPLFGLGTMCFALSTPAATNTVLMGNFFFNPTNLTINVGDTVRWSNTVASTVFHDSTRTNTPFQWASGDLGSLNPTFLLTFSLAGTFPYFCNRHVILSMPALRHPEMTGTVSVASLNLPPSVSLTNPPDNSKFSAPASIVLQASANDDGSVTNVQFFSGPALLGSDDTAPFAFTLSNVAAGNYLFTARAHDNSGLSATSAVVNVFVLTNAILSAPARPPNGQFQFTIQGIAGQTYTMESFTNLTSWSPLVTNVAPASSFNVTDFTSTNVLRRFYRARFAP